MSEIVEIEMYRNKHPDLKEITKIIEKYIKGELRVEIDGRYAGLVLDLKFDYDYRSMEGKTYKVIAVCKFS